MYEFGRPGDVLKTPTRWAAGGLGKMPEPGQRIPAHRIKLDEPNLLSPDSIQKGDEFGSPDTVIRDCYFYNSLAIGIRLQAPGTVIERNHIEWTCLPAIQLLTQTEKWGESAHPDRSIVRNNTVVNPLQFLVRRGARDFAIGITSPGDLRRGRWISDIQVVGNTIRDAPRTAIFAHGVDKIVVSGNRVEGDAHYTKGWGESKASAVVLDQVVGAEVADNLAQRPGPGASAQPVKVSEAKDRLR